MIQIKEYDENAFKGYQIKLKDGTSYVTKIRVRS